MIDVKKFHKILNEEGFDFFTGVPDSLLKHFCAFISDNLSSQNNIIAVNEGTALSLATGKYLATGKPSLVYLQNSGQGNLINPLMSLLDKEVYSIPVLLLVGWRGEPGIKDEPQHIKQGRVTKNIFDALELEYEILSDNPSKAEEQLKFASNYLSKNKKPFALIVKKNTFSPYKKALSSSKTPVFTREIALKEIVDSLEGDSVVVSTTGKLSRELFEYREEKKQTHEKDFLTVGSMGHASQIALGIALSKKNRVYCFDGDGAALMHLGGLSSIASLKPQNFVHILFNNGAHDSVGGQKTTAFSIDWKQVTKGLGYKEYFQATSKEELTKRLIDLKELNGPIFLEVRIDLGSRSNLGRPTISPKDNKGNFMTYLSSLEDFK